MLAASLVLALPVWAGENPSGRTRTGEYGDYLEVLVPAATLVTSIARKDYEGARQFSWGLITTAATTRILKEAVNKERPDGRDSDGFPSSHTAVSFHAAAYVHERYGWRWAVPVYLTAGWVGHSRVHDDRHDVEDVLAGAALGVLAARYFTTEYRGIEVTPDVADGYVGLRLSWRPR